MYVLSSVGASTWLRVSVYGQAVAASVLRNLTGFVEIREIFMEEENGVLILLGVLVSGTIRAQENVIGSLCNLCLDDESLKLFVVKERRG